MTLLSIRQAAEMLGYTEKGIRRIVIRSRAKACGARTTGPTITFFQAGTRGAIRFRPEWIQQFIDENTVDPSAATAHPARSKKRQGRRAANGAPANGTGKDRDLDLLRI